MNERIKEFAKQTGYIWHASGDPKVYEFTPEKLEKFAELIVQECAEVAGCNGHVSGFALGDLIKKHFGVEE